MLGEYAVSNGLENYLINAELWMNDVSYYYINIAAMCFPILPKNKTTPKRGLPESDKEPITS